MLDLDRTPLVQIEADSLDYYKRGLKVLNSLVEFDLPHHDNGFKVQGLFYDLPIFDSKTLYEDSHIMLLSIMKIEHRNNIKSSYCPLLIEYRENEKGTKANGFEIVVNLQGNFKPIKSYLLKFENGIFSSSYHLVDEGIGINKVKLSSFLEGYNEIR